MTCEWRSAFKLLLRYTCFCTIISRDTEVSFLAAESINLQDDSVTSQSISAQLALPIFPCNISQALDDFQAFIKRRVSGEVCFDFACSISLYRNLYRNLVFLVDSTGTWMLRAAYYRRPRFSHEAPKATERIYDVTVRDRNGRPSGVCETELPR
jgi:hypothetical protein